MENRRFYVYGFFNEQWKEFFYIGKGTGNRYRSFGDRNKNVLAVLRNYPCKPVILMDKLTEEEAYDLERKTKQMLRSMGKPIIDFEHDYTSKRQREGIEMAKKQGKYQGRKKRNVNYALLEELMDKYKDHQITKTEISKQLGVSRPTLDKLINELEYVALEMDGYKRELLANAVGETAFPME